MMVRHIVLTASLAIAAWLAFFGDKAPNTGIAEPLERAPSSTPATTTSANLTLSSVQSASRKTRHGPAILALQPRDTLIGNPQSTNLDNRLFATQTWTPPPPPPPPPPKPTPPPPPTAPPLPFTYLGKKSEAGSWEVYLARGERTYIVRAQTVIEGTYRVESIIPPTLSLTYLPFNQMQSLSIGGTD